MRLTERSSSLDRTMTTDSVLSAYYISYPSQNFWSGYCRLVGSDTKFLVINCAIALFEDESLDLEAGTIEVKFKSSANFFPLLARDHNPATGSFLLNMPPCHHVSILALSRLFFWHLHFMTAWIIFLFKAPTCTRRIKLQSMAHRMHQKSMRPARTPMPNMCQQV